MVGKKCVSKATLWKCSNAVDQGSIPGSGGSTPVILPGEFHGQRSFTGYSLWGHKESDTTERLTHTHTHTHTHTVESIWPHSTSLKICIALGIYARPHVHKDIKEYASQFHYK